MAAQIAHAWRDTREACMGDMSEAATSALVLDVHAPAARGEGVGAGVSMHMPSMEWSR